MRAARIRVGVIGTGFGAQVHLPSLAALPDFEIVAVCGRNGAKVEAIADAYDIRNTFTDYRHLIACNDVEAVTIATPPALHHPMVIAAITAGKHVLCEKPMARNANEAREMVRMAEMRSVTAMLSHEFRFVPARARMKELLDEGYIGAVSLAHLSFLRPLLSDPRGKAWQWLVDTDAGGGMLGALGAHFVDAMRWWFGELNEVAGACRSASRPYAPVAILFFMPMRRIRSRCSCNSRRAQSATSSALPPRRTGRARRFASSAPRGC